MGRANGARREPTIRRGHADDVIECTRVWRATVDRSLPAPAAGYQLYQHELDTGTLLVAEVDGVLAGFAGSITRGERWFLGDLFVHPEHHGLGLGRQLLDQLVAVDAPGKLRATMASDDPRALTLYTQLGMTPRWPCFSLIGRSDIDMPTVADPAGATVDRAERCSAIDLAEQAQPCAYDLSPIDLDYWERTAAAEFVLVADAGGAVVRWSTPFAIAHPDAISVGPLFARSPEVLPGVVAAVLAFIRSEDPDHPTKLYVPGTSAALRPLLDAGHRIEEFDLFSSSSPSILDPTRVLPSHDLL
ncbi:MAG: GNAT family N-acetyltransferase [Acidimicrobiales bacterium]